MTFAEVLSKLRGGQVVMHDGCAYRLDDGRLTLVNRQPGGAWRVLGPAQSANLLASDWKLWEEPAPEPHTTSSRCAAAEATISRLTRELAEARRRHCLSCVCVACEQLAANAKLSAQGSR